MQLEAAMRAVREPSTRATGIEHAYAVVAGIVVMLDQYQFNDGKIALATKASLLPTPAEKYQPKRALYARPMKEDEAFAPLVEEDIVNVAGGAIREKAKAKTAATEMLKSRAE